MITVSPSPVVAVAGKKKKNTDSLAVQVAKDVINQLGLLIPTPGTYIRRKGLAALNIYSTAEILRASANVVSIDCEVCAIGASFLSMARVVPERVSGLRIGTTVTYKQNLYTIFSMLTVTLMEAAFEGWDYPDRAREFYEKYPSAKARLRAIMENIISNKGEFVL